MIQDLISFTIRASQIVEYLNMFSMYGLPKQVVLLIDFLRVALPIVGDKDSSIIRKD